MAYKVLSFQRVMLQEQTPAGYILTILNTSETPNHLITLWGNSSGYVWTDWGDVTIANVNIFSYEDGFTSCIWYNGIPNAQTVTELTGAEMSYDTTTLDIGTVLCGMTPASYDTGGIVQTVTGGSAGVISSESYKAYGRQKGWLISHSASLAVICTQPQIVCNIGAYPILGNFIEVSIEPDTTNVTVTTQRCHSRLRWGDTGKALCTIVTAEGTGSNAGYVDLIETPGPLIAGVPFNDRVVVWKPNSIYEVVWAGYPQFFVPSVTVADNGTIAPNAVKKTGQNSCVFIGNDDIYLYNIGGEIKPIGTNIRPLFFGYSALYSVAELKKAVIQVYDDRQEIWLWIPGYSTVYKYKKGAWFSTDYSGLGYGTLTLLAKDYYYNVSTGYKGFVPLLFFGDANATLADSDTTGYKKITLTAYYDLQTSFNTASAYFITKDFPMGLDGRVTELTFQAKSETIDGVVTVCHSIDEGRNYSATQTVKVDKSKDFKWYSYFCNTTAESIRFKFTTSTGLSFGKIQLVGTQRKRGGF